MKIEIKSIIDSTLQLYKKYLNAVLIVAAIALALDIINVYLAKNRLVDRTQPGLQFVWEMSSFLVSTLAFAVLVVYISWSENKKKFELAEAFNFALRRLLPVYITSIILVFVIGFGILLLVIPGIIFFTMYSLSTYIVLLDSKAPVESMRLSKEATKGNRMNIFIIYFLFVFITFSIMTTYAYLPDLVSSVLMQVFYVSSYLFGYLLYKNLYRPEKKKVKAA